MRFFAYHGTDSQGRPTQGTIQAASADEAQRLLVGGGVRTRAVRELSAAGVPAKAPVAVSTPVVQAPAPKPVVQAPAATLPAAKYKFAGNKTSFFFFEALARYVKSGVAANRALEELGQRARKEWMGERLLQASAAVAKGASLADALESCACFPTGAVGTIRAGEASGAVPDACFQAAVGCEQAHKLGTRCAAMMIMTLFVVAYIPVGYAFVHGSVDAMNAQAAANSTLPANATAAAKIGAQLGRVMPIAVPFWILTFGLWRLWLTHRMQRARHRAILLTPILSGRARDESLARASWALTELARAGLSPARAMHLAADACPNLIVADRFREEAGRMREHDKLSTALRATGMMDPQLVDVVENGELAGDVPGAVASVHRATSSEFERKNSTAHTKIWFVVLPILGVVTVIVLANLYKVLYSGLIQAMLSDT